VLLDVYMTLSVVGWDIQSCTFLLIVFLVPRLNGGTLNAPLILVILGLFLPRLSLEQAL